MTSAAEVDTEQGNDGPVPRELYQDLADRRVRLKASIATLERQRLALNQTSHDLLYSRLVAWREEFEDEDRPRTPKGWGWHQGEEPWDGWWRDRDPSWEFCGTTRRDGGPEAVTFRMWLLDDDGKHAFHYSIPTSFVFGEDDPQCGRIRPEDDAYCVELEGHQDAGLEHLWVGGVNNLCLTEPVLPTPGRKDGGR